MNKIYTLTALFVLLFFGATLHAQYCTPIYLTGTASDDYIDGVILGSINNVATGDPNGNFYNNYTSQSTTLQAGSTYPMTINGSTYGSGENYFVYIDFNGDFDFTDANELVYQSPTSTISSQVFNFTITVPGNISSITTRMRVVNIYDGTPPVITTSCPTSANNTYGETEDYTVILLAAAIGSPVPNFSVNNQSINTGSSVSFTDLSTNNPTSWSWSFPGGTPSTSTAQNPTVTYNTSGVYNVSFTATNSNGSNTITQSNYITVTDISTSYCVPDYSTGTSSDDYIDGVILGSINNITSGDPNGNFYNDYTNQSTALIAGNTYQMTINGSTYSSGENYMVYIDYNGDFDFTDANELVYQSPTSTVANQVFNFSFTVPSNVSAITTRMRVVDIYDGAPPFTPTPCPTSASNTYGETEDYTVVISAASIVMPVSNFSMSVNQICEDESIAFTNTSTDASSFVWYFLNGTPSTSTIANPVVTFNTAGTAGALLVASNSLGSDSASQVINIQANPQPVITLNGNALSTSATFSSYQWYLSGVIIPNETNQSFTPSVDGDYTVEVTNAFGCGGTSATFLLVTTGLRNTKSNNTFSIYPNPAHQQLTIQVPNSSIASTAVVVDILGNEVMSEEITSRKQTLSLESLTNGIYFLRINNHSVKFLKQ
jgi:PKD repeat protein